MRAAAAAGRRLMEEPVGWLEERWGPRGRLPRL